ncbi:cytoglobin-1, partial [Tachysurus ichikawai]
MEGNRGEHEQVEKPEAFTEEERVMIKTTWSKVYENKEAAGVAVFT